MDTVEIKILQPEARSKLVEMKNDRLIEFSNGDMLDQVKKPLQFGCMKGLVLYMSEDFDAPLDDFEEYM